MARMLDGADLIRAAAEMGRGQAASMARAMSVPAIFHGMEKIFASGAEPIIACGELLQEVSGFFRFTARHGLEQLPAIHGGRDEAERDPEAATGAHYGGLFEGFSTTSYRDEPWQLLSERLRRNGIELPNPCSSRLLDAGCGGGRYAIAWRRLGAGEVVGIDISPTNIATARSHLGDAGATNVEFIEGNVLALPFPDANFDIVFSNGVLHHTVDWRRGIGELLRVLRPGGLGWLYLIEEPGGLFWELIEIMRVVMTGEERSFAREVLRLMGIPANRIFYMLDHVMAPINIRLRPEEIEEVLRESGASSIMRLRRGADFDRVEHIYQGEPYAEVKYGVGENRYIFSR